MFAEKIREVEDIVKSQNEWRLGRTINLIASENVLSQRARLTLPSDFTHRYAEGHPGARYYQGTDFIDKIESETEEQLKKLFSCKNTEVRTISGNLANETCFSALIKEGSNVIANSLSRGAHISHMRIGSLGKYAKKIINYPYTKDGLEIDIPKAKDLITTEKPPFIVLGKSLFLFPEPVSELKEVCKEVGTLVLYDGAHVLGLIAGGQFQVPLKEGADILMGSTHKTFFGPQRGVILSDLDEEKWKLIDKKAFPGSLSNHHLFSLPALLITIYEFSEFGREYAKQVVANAKALGASLDKAGIEVVAKEKGYTKSHQIAVDVTKFGGGEMASSKLKDNDIIVNKNMLPQYPDAKPTNPPGLRIGVQEMTRFGMKEPEMQQIANLIKECIANGKSVKSEVNRLRSKFTVVKFSFDESK